MPKIILLLSLNLLTMTLTAQNFTGDWKGTLSVQGTQLPLVFHIQETEGQLQASMDSPNQGAFGIKMDSCSVQDGQLILKAQSLMMTFTARLQDEQLEGTFQQGMAQLPLKMNRMRETEGPGKRPQDPVAPFSYLAEEISFRNASAGITLSGTLTRPRSGPAHQVIILISGSGPQDRNSEIMNHRPFWVWADYLSRQGIAVLRFDDRGVGASEGDFGAATSLDFASDVMAAIDFIAAHPVLGNSSIGLLGHSEGGMIAPIVAVERPTDVAFLVLLAAPGVPIDELMYAQYSQVIEGQGITGAVKDQLLTQQKKLYQLVKNSKYLPVDTLREEIFSVYEQQNGGLSLRDNPQVKSAVAQFSSPWMRYFLAYDPQPTLAQLRLPVLAINGDKDVQVIAEQNITGIVNSMQEEATEQLTTRIFPGLNHLFQAATTGQVNEYAQIEQTIHPEVLEYVSTWIKALR